MCGIIKNDLRISHACDIISTGGCKVNPFFPQTHVFFTVFCPFRQRQRALPSAGGAKGLCPLESRASAASAKGTRPFGIPFSPAGGTKDSANRRCSVLPAQNVYLAVRPNGRTALPPSPPQRKKGVKRGEPLFRGGSRPPPNPHPPPGGGGAPPPPRPAPRGGFLRPVGGAPPRRASSAEGGLPRYSSSDASYSSSARRMSSQRKPRR